MLACRLRAADIMATAARAVFVLFLLLGSAGAASAEPEEGCESKPFEPSQASRPTGIGADAGLGSAIGFAGLTVTRVFLDCFRIELGGGFGYSGWQLSLMPKIAVDMAHGKHYLVIGAGVSVAFPTRTEAFGTTATGHPVWLNVDGLGYEVRNQDGFSFAAAIGVTRGLGGGTVCRYVECSAPDDMGDVAGVWSFQTRIQFAYWF
jgi:hypothetical protein